MKELKNELKRQLAVILPLAALLVALGYAYAYAWHEECFSIEIGGAYYEYCYMVPDEGD